MTQLATWAFGNPVTADFQMKWMNRDIQTVFRIVGLLLHIPGVMAVVSLPICFIFHEEYAVLPFGLTAIASFGLGQILCRWFRRAGEINLQHAMLIVALSWAIIPLPKIFAVLQP